MRVAMEYERSRGRETSDVSSLDTNSGELRLMGIKGIAGDEGVVSLTPNEKRTSEDRRDCYSLYVVTSCKSASGPKPVPARPSAA